MKINIGDELYHKSAGRMIVETVAENEMTAKIILGNRSGYSFPLSDFGKTIFFKEAHKSLSNAFSNLPADYFIFVCDENKKEEEKLKQQKQGIKNQQILERQKAERERAELIERIREEQIFQKKVTEVQKYFSERQYPLNREQAGAVIHDAKHVLVAARAGSGKTHLIGGKALYLIEKMKIPRSTICILAFNNGAVKELKTRFGEDNRPTIRTFHSLATEWARIETKVLANNEKNEFIKLIIEDLKEEASDFKKLVYQFFRKESTRIDGKTFNSPNNYFAYIKNSRYATLQGQDVKSIGEKWIADYLFEHDIVYKYEREFYPSRIKREMLTGSVEEQNEYEEFLNENIDRKRRKIIKPDFFLRDYNLVWEHWAIDENNQNEEVKKRFNEEFDTTWDEYYKLLKWKQKFWKTDQRKRLYAGGDQRVLDIINISSLLETSVADLSDGREAFEEKLDRHLLAYGVKAKKLDEDIIIQRAWEKAIDQFCKMITSFIEKYQQHYFDKPYSEFKEVIEQYTENEKVYEFLKLGLTVLKHYETVLSSRERSKRFECFEQYHIDFNKILYTAIERVKSGCLDDEVSGLSYLLIDEYQDFSELFYCFITAIMSRNPDIKLFCVGDTWQAINRFMGSDTKYFDQFHAYFPDHVVVELSTNRRSVPGIVSVSNEFMRRNGFGGTPAKPFLKESIDTVIEKYDVECMWLEQRRHQEHAEEFELDKKFINVFEKDTTAAKYLKKCIEVILTNRGCSILILHRQHRVLNGKYRLHKTSKGAGGKSFHERLIEYLQREERLSKDECNKITSSTIHASKGTEADVVIVLETNISTIPLIHPDNELYEVFGEGAEITMQDEQRLFYVALTRAKKKIFLLFDGDRASKFLSQVST